MDKITDGGNNEKIIYYRDNSTLLAILDATKTVIMAIFDFIKTLLAAVIGIVIDLVILVALFIDGNTSKFPECSILFRLMNR